MVALVGALNLGLVRLFGAVQPDVELPDGVELDTYTGWTNSLFFESDDARYKAVVVPDVGGRIMHYSIKGENIIFEVQGSAGKTLSNTKESFWVGGYQCDIGPEIRGIPDHPRLWMGPHQWSAPKANTVVVRSEPDAATGVQVEKEFLFSPDSGEIGLTQRIKNISGREVAYCFWDRTLCRGGGFAFFPLNKKSRFTAGWSLRRTVEGGRFEYDGQKPESSQVKILDGVLLVEARGEATKIGADSDAGWVAYARGKLLFVKHFPYVPGANYSDGGNSVEVYWDPQVAELEPLSPEARLKPGEQREFPEKWSLIELKKEVTTFEQARALAGKIERSPFVR